LEFRRVLFRSDRPAFTVHAEFDSPFRMSNPITELIGCELTALVSIENLRTTMPGNSSLQGLFTPIRAHGIAQRPAYHIAAVQINNGTQVQVATLHRDISD